MKFLSSDFQLFFIHSITVMICEEKEFDGFPKILSCSYWLVYLFSNKSVLGYWKNLEYSLLHVWQPFNRNLPSLWFKQKNLNANKTFNWQPLFIPDSKYISLISRFKNYILLKHFFIKMRRFEIYSSNSLWKGAPAQLLPFLFIY